MHQVSQHIVSLSSFCGNSKIFHDYTFMVKYQLFMQRCKADHHFIAIFYAISTLLSVHLIRNDFFVATSHLICTCVDVGERSFWVLIPLFFGNNTCIESSWPFLKILVQISSFITFHTMRCTGSHYRRKTSSKMREVPPVEKLSQGFHKLVNMQI